MRLLVDLQACQTPDSRQRGIGRYSLAHIQELARQAGEHELWLLLSDRFPETIPGLLAAFDDLVPPERIRLFSAPEGVAELYRDNLWRSQAARLLRQQAIDAVAPDIVHVSSLFEGLVDDASTHIEPGSSSASAVTLYDLIPYIYADRYLGAPAQRDWYFRKLQSLRSTDLALAISESSRREGIDVLGLPADRVVNISSAIDPSFRPLVLSAAEKSQLRQRYGIRGDFIMYTGGIDARKNIDGLIEAYALLPPALQSRYQLAVICSIRDADRLHLQGIARAAGLAPERVVFTGYVPHEDLLALYNEAALFVFPSLHEGFGLPVLEAMACGTATIGANTSSIPEVIGRDDALFDPRSGQAIAAKIAQVLTDENFAAELARYGLQRAGTFSWSATARRSWDAFAALQASRQDDAVQVAVPAARPRLAFVSPLPPVQSGIADYSVELLPALARYYEIELIVAQEEVVSPWLTANFPVRNAEWLLAHADRYDRVLYQIGNSHYHGHMFDLLEQVAGTVVLHDFYLGNVVRYLDASNVAPGLWTQALLHSHGYHALPGRNAADDEARVARYPANRDLLEKAAGVIVHSEFARKLCSRWYEDDLSRDWHVVPHPRFLPPEPTERTRLEARARLGVPADALVVCSFGFIGPFKCHRELVEAWLASPLAERADAWLVLVGRNSSDAYGDELAKRVERHGRACMVRITGFAEGESYKDWLQAADIAVQLRRDSRGETSGTVLDCLAHGLPLIYNAHGAAAELPDGVGQRLPAEVDTAELAAAITALAGEPATRDALGQRARAFVRQCHAPDIAARGYFEAIESFHAKSRIVGTAQSRLAEQSLLEQLAQTDGAAAEPLGGIGVVSQAIVRNRTPARKLLLIEVEQELAPPLKELCRRWLQNPPVGWHLEPVMAWSDGYFHAHGWTQSLLDLRSALPELRVNPPIGTRWLRLGGSTGWDALPANVLLTQPARLGLADLARDGGDGVDQALREWLAGGRFLAPLQPLLAPSSDASSSAAHGSQAPATAPAGATH